MQVLEEQDRERTGVDKFKSNMTDEDRWRMVLAYGHELDEAHGLNGYDFALVCSTRGALAG